MKFPKLKNALLCRVLVYIVVIGTFIVPIVIMGSLSFVPDAIKIIFAVACIIGLIAYILKNFVLLMTIDASTAWLHSHNKARKRFALPKSFSVEKAISRVSMYGKGYEPSHSLPMPLMLRYKSSFPISIYSKGIEKILTVYRTEYLDKKEYYAIVNSAKTNSKALEGKKKHKFLDKAQKKSPLNRVTVAFIFADKIDEAFRDRLPEEVRKNSGDGFDKAVLPCVVDIEKCVCVFDSLCIPYNGYQYPVKNRGIKIIRRCIFGGFFTYKESNEKLKPIEDVNPEQSLWEYWRYLKKEIVLDEKKKKKRHSNMTHRELIFDDGYIYVKWEERSIWQAVELDEEKRVALIDEIYQWEYPKRNKIKKDRIIEIKSLIDTYFAQEGYTTRYESFED